ncbi:MAG: PEP-CTERM/exosortase system-associated acyltransferase [Pseudomonadota bacterium]
MQAQSGLEFSKLCQNFERYFDLSLATTEAEKRTVYKLRYRVFCESLGFLDPTAFEDRHEEDDFDDHSVHCLITHRATGKAAGCVRLVNADATSDMPLERRFKGALNPETVANTMHRRGRIAEISRLAVGYPFSMRKRPGAERKTRDDGAMFSKAERQVFPLVGVTLMLAAGASADLLRRTELFTFMEKSLQKRLRRIGVETTRVGEDINFNGVRAPYFFNIDDAVRSFPHDIRIYYDRIRDHLDESMGATNAPPHTIYGGSRAFEYPHHAGADLRLA